MNTTIKKEVIDFGNDLMSISNGEKIILDSFAVMYITLKNKKNINEEYKLLDNFFKKIEMIPEMNEKGEIFYKKVINKENPFEKVVQKKDNKDFFKKKNKTQCEDCEHKNYCPNFSSYNRNFGEKDLINDIFFSLEEEIGDLIYIFNKF